MDGVGSGPPSGGRNQTDDAANYSPSRTPPLLHNVSGNDSSSAGSPSGSRRHGSTGEKEKKNREERLRLIKERQEQEHEKRLAELKAAYEKETKVRQMKDAERLRRIQEIKTKEATRRQAVEERRRRLETEDKEKREQILAKYKEYEQRNASQRDQRKPVYAFGSSTPRTLAYLEHLDNSMRVYNSRWPTAAPGGPEDELATAKGPTSPDKRAISACSFTRKALTARSSPNLSPLHQQHQRSRIASGTYHKPQLTVTRSTKDHVLAPSGRWGGSMAASMYGGSAALSTASARGGGERDPLANVRSMTTSFAVGETSVAPHVKNVRAKGPLSPASNKSQSTTRLTRSAATPRKTRQQDVIVEENEDGTGVLKVNQNGGASKRPGSDGGGSDGAPSTATTNKQKAKGVSSARTPSAPPPSVRRPIGDAPAKVSAPTASKANLPPKEKTKTTSGKAALPPKHPAKESTEAPKPIRKPKTNNGVHSPPPVPNGGQTTLVSGGTSPDLVQELADNSGQTPTVAETVISIVQGINLEKDNLYEYKEEFNRPPNVDIERDEFVIRVDSVPVTPSTPEKEMAGQFEPNVQNVDFNEPDPQIVELTPNVDMTQSVDTAQMNVQHVDQNQSNIQQVDMTQSTTEIVPSVPKPTGQSGKVLSKEEATAALAERRRLAREQMEREKELERQREEQRRLEEEEARRREEEEFRRQEEEELRMLEEARQHEEERIRKLMEEEEKRREIEAKQREEEERKKAETEARAREEADRAERERKEAEEKFKKDEQERLDRKKRLEAIMQRTRTPGGSQAVPPNTQSSATPLINGNNESMANDTSMYLTPDSTMSNTNSGQTPSSSLLKKIAHVRPEVGRSLENILNRVKSTPNVSGAETMPGNGGGGAMESIMTTSLSADKVGETPTTTGDHSRLTQSFYATPNSQFVTSFNHSGAAAAGGDTAKTEYDIDAQATRSESDYAKILVNEDVTSSESNGANKALVTILGVDSNANQSDLASPKSMEYSGGSTPSGANYHNNNVNGTGGAEHHGHGTDGAPAASASDSDASSAVTVIHQMSPRDLPVDDLFSSPKKVGNPFDDVINDNVSMVVEGNVSHTAPKVSQSHEERPLLEF